MKWTKITLTFLISFILTSVFVQGMAFYGNFTYGSCDYGRNSPPDIDSFQPSDTTPSFVPTINVTFNITYSDCENDTVLLEWYVNNTFNVSDQNLSYIFNTVGIFNITANLTDPFDSTKQEWIVTISVIITPAAKVNITDILFVPNFVTESTVIVIKVNITAIETNLTGVFAYLNIDSNFDFLDETPQNQSVGNVFTINETEVQWFIAVPDVQKSYQLNVSYTNNTFTTLGISDKLYVGVETDTMAIAITLLLTFVISAYFVLIMLLTKETFSAHGAVKAGLMVMIVWFLLIPMDAAIKLNDNAGDYGIAKSLEIMYVILIYLNVIMTLYFILFIIIGFARSVQGNLPEEERGEE